jgi:N-methylhydantoinase B
VIEMENGLDEPFVFSCAFERLRFAARGFDDGLSGAPGYVGLASGDRLSGKGSHLIPRGRVVIMSPGGGGIGDPKRRDRTAVEADLANGLISADAAKSVYGEQPAKRAEKPVAEYQYG